MRDRSEVVMGRRCILMVLDSVGIGELPDAAGYGDQGADTLGHICAAGPLRVPNLERLGLACIRPLEGLRAPGSPMACYGMMAEASAGKDSTTGHWELAGLVVEEPFQTYPDGFPPSLVAELTAATGLEVLGNVAASGTAIIAELGEEHQRTGKPIVYTSADPVLQIAAHEEVIPVERLYELCETAFRIATRYGVNRVIARPFLGSPPDYRRTERRRDFSLPPPAPTVLDRLSEEGVQVVTVGKVDQLFAGRGISRAVTAKGNRQGVDETLATFAGLSRGLIFTNLVDFDMLYGHRRDVAGYARALEELDARIDELTSALDGEDLLILTADHGNDPTFRGTDHTREYVPLLVVRPGAARGRSLGVRETFADVGATVADFFGVPWPGAGKSFLGEL